MDDLTAIKNAVSKRVLAQSDDLVERLSGLDLERSELVIRIKQELAEVGMAATDQELALLVQDVERG
ncbi:hypothetical protein LHP98_05210 [Rhodobacter sp. Har01]|uniref:hypothetical protein n=1 Tax=Rhodobacter sp. Har01 TaxID=2883999 RepID=UPI001D08C2BB|nr:hypothetical protein [Rhodobacter sp. Har01]MCB6177528.1 hypothetical protein [Rhodobacter sp. Har01]